MKDTLEYEKELTDGATKLGSLIEEMIRDLQTPLAVAATLGAVTSKLMADARKLFTLKLNDRDLEDQLTIIEASIGAGLRSLIYCLPEDRRAEVIVKSLSCFTTEEPKPNEGVSNV